MEQYVSKAALVVEIEKELNTTKKYSTEYVNGKKYALKKILSLINTLETKEVDLEKEIGKYLDANDIEFSHQIKLFDFAKHFFELGLKVVQKGGII